MFGSNPKTTPSAVPSPSASSPARGEESSPHRAGNLLSSGVSIKGEVTFRTELVIDGEVEGSIKSSGTLTVGEHARIRGEIRAKNVTVHGTVEGNVFASDRCSLQAGATLRGDIEAPRLAVDETAAFFGSARISTKGG